MANAKGKPTEPMPLHRILREVYRHYSEFRDYVSATGNHVIDHGYFVYDKDTGQKVSKEQVTISFWDLHRGLNKLSPRKREAVVYNVIKDWKQRDVAERMGITTVSVGQYVEQAMLQLAEEYFAGENENSEDLRTQEQRDAIEPQSVQPPPRNHTQDRKAQRVRPQADV